MRLLPKIAATLGLATIFVFLQAQADTSQGGIANQPGNEPIKISETVISDSVKMIVTWCNNLYHARLICTKCGKETTVDSAYGETEAEAKDALEGTCDNTDTTSPGSVIDNDSLNYIHSVFDFSAEVPDGCAPCGSSGAAGPYPSVYLKRIHRYRDGSEKSSFGPGTFSNWDASLTLFIGAENKPYVDLFAPELNGRRRFTQVGSEFRDLTYKASKGLRLYDASNNLTTVKASAVRAEHENLYGLIYEFEFFDLDSARRTGRLTKIRDRHRDIFTLTYVDAATSTITPTSRKWRFDSVTDSYGQTLTFTHTGNAIKLCYLPNGSFIDYMYWTANQAVTGYSGTFSYANYLTKITYPDSSESKFARTYDADLQKLVCSYDDAAATGTHRRKAVYLSTMIAGYSAVDSNDFDTAENGTSINFFNQSSSMVRLVRNGAGTDADYTNPEAGEVTYLSITGGDNPLRFIYEGGGKLKWVNLNTERYHTWFNLPTSSTNPYDFLDTNATKEPAGFFPSIDAYEYLDNRQSRPREIQRANGTKEFALYDNQGFQTLKTLGSATSGPTKRTAYTADAKTLWTQDFDGTLTDYDYEDTPGTPWNQKDNVGKLIKKRVGLEWGTLSAIQYNQPGLRAIYKEGNFTTLSAASSATATRRMRSANISLTPAERASQFAIVFSGKLNVPSGQQGTHTFTAYADDGIELKINGTVVLSRNGTISDTQNYTNLNAIAPVTGSASLVSGVNTISVTYFNSNGTPRLELRANGPITGNQEAPIPDHLFTSDAHVGDRALVPTDKTVVYKWEYYPSGPEKGFLRKEFYPGPESSVFYREHLYTFSGNKIATHEIREPSDSAASPTLAITDTVKKVEYFTSGLGSGQIASITDGEGHTTSFEYDTRGRLIKTTFPDLAIEQTIYPTSGANSHQPSARRERSSDTAPIYATFEYDAAGRLTDTNRGCSDDDGTGALSTESFEYLHGTNKVVKRISDGDTSQTFYDYRGRVKESWRWADSDLAEISRTVYRENKVFYREDRFGRRTYFAYDATDAKLVRTLTEAVAGGAGNPANFAAVLTKTRILTENPAYAITDYTYDSVTRQLTDEIDPMGVVTRHEYDELGRKTDQYLNYTDGVPTADANLHTQWIYNSQGLVTHVYPPRRFTDAPDSEDSYTYTTRQKLDSRIQKLPPDGTSITTRTEIYTYDKDGRMVTTKDFANEFWTYYYLCCGRLGAKVDPLGHGERYTYNKAGDMTRVETVANLAIPNSSGYSSAPGLTATDFIYDNLHRRTNQTVWLNGATPGTGTGLTTTWEYLTDTTDSRLSAFTNTTTGLLATGGVSLTGAANGSAVITTNPAGERSLSISDGLGRTIAAAQIGKSGNTPYTYAYTYFDETDDEHPLLVRSTVLSRGLTDDNPRFRVHSVSDGLGFTRYTRTLTSDDGTTASYQKVTMTYLANGAMSSRSETAGSQLLKTTYGYDPLRRQRWSQDEVEKTAVSVSGVLTGLTYKPTTGAFRAYTYDAAGNLTYDYDALGRFNKHDYDLLGRRTSTLDHLSNTTAQAYDKRDQLRALRDASGNLTIWTYDQRGDLIRKDFGWSNISSYTDTLQTWLASNTSSLPAAGSTLNITRPAADNDRILYTYDAASRLTGTADQSVTSTTPNLEFTYDGASRLLTRGLVYTTNTIYDRFAYDPASRLRLAHSALYANTIERTYDDYGRQSKEILRIESATLSATDFNTWASGGTAPTELFKEDTTFGYDRASRVTSVTYPSGFVLNKTYDYRSNLNTLVNSSTTLADYGYDAANRETTRLLGNGLTTTRAWNADSTLASLTVKNSSNATIDPLTLPSLGYTTAKELTSVGRVGTAMSQFGWNATYDAKSRLDTWTRTGFTTPNEDYALDAAGNWNELKINGTVSQTRTHFTSSGAPGKNQIVTLNGNAFTHDARGNMTQNDQGDTFTYDILNQLKSSNVIVGSNNPVSTYKYDALGRRVRQTVVDGSSTVLDKIYFYGPDFKLLESADITTATSSSFVISTSSFITVVWGRSFNELVWTSADGYLHGDQINSVIGNSSSSGTVTKILTYTPYGQRSEWTLSGTTLTATTFAIGEMDFGYSGELRDPSGLIYYGYRYYSPELGRWINRDPIGERGGVNLYEMVEGMSLSKIDFLGHASWKFFRHTSMDYDIEFDNQFEKPSYRGVDEKSMNNFPGNSPTLGWLAGRGVNVIEGPHDLSQRLINWYFDKNGDDFNISRFNDIKSETMRALWNRKVAIFDKVESMVASFDCAVGNGEHEGFEFEFEGIEELPHHFGKISWVIGGAKLAFKYKVFAAVRCKCSLDGKIQGEAEIGFDTKNYFYDQFADAADPGHEIPDDNGAQEFIGGRQFHIKGAWGRFYHENAVYE